MDWAPQNNRIIWGLMTPEEQAAMEAAEHGLERWTGFGWVKDSDRTWCYSAVYRAIPAPVAKPDIDPAIWRFLPKWVTHIAMDSNLKWFGYEYRSKMISEGTWDRAGNTWPLSQFNLPTEGFDWRNSCIARPEGM